MGDSKERNADLGDAGEEDGRGGGVSLSEGGEENPPPQRFQGLGRSELTKTPRLRPEVVSARRGEPERPSCNKSDLAILLGQVRLRLKLESRLAPRCSPPPLLIHLNTNYRAFLLTLWNIDWCLVRVCERALSLHTQIKTEVTIPNMLEDGWALPMYCIFSQDFIRACGPRRWGQVRRCLSAPMK